MSLLTLCGRRVFEVYCYVATTRGRSISEKESGILSGSRGKPRLLRLRVLLSHTVAGWKNEVEVLIRCWRLSDQDNYDLLGGWGLGKLGEGRSW